MEPTRISDTGKSTVGEIDSLIENLVKMVADLENCHSHQRKSYQIEVDEARNALRAAFLRADVMSDRGGGYSSGASLDATAHKAGVSANAYKLGFSASGWDRWYDVSTIDEDLRRRLSYHDLRRLGAHALLAFGKVKE